MIARTLLIVAALLTLGFQAATAQPSDVEERVKKIVVEHLGVDENDVTRVASFVDDLGVDELDTVELVMAFEEEFGLDIGDAEAEAIVTVGDAIRLIERRNSGGEWAPQFPDSFGTAVERMEDVLTDWQVYRLQPIGEGLDYCAATTTDNGLLVIFTSIDDDGNGVDDLRIDLVEVARSSFLTELRGSEFPSVTVMVDESREWTVKGSTMPDSVLLSLTNDWLGAIQGGNELRFETGGGKRASVSLRGSRPALESFQECQKRLESERAEGPAVTEPSAAGPADEMTIQSFAADVLDGSRNGPVLVNFWAPWCGPCREMTPILENAVKNAKPMVIRLVTMNVDDHPEIAGQLGLKSIPAVIAFRDGKPLDSFMGAIPESQIVAFVGRAADLSGPTGDVRAAPAVAGTADATSLGSFGSWQAWQGTSAEGVICFVSAQPERSQPPGVNRGPIHVIVIHRMGTGSRNEVQTLIGYPFGADQDASARIDGRTFPMITEGAAAWLARGDHETDFVTAMKAGASLVVEGTSQRGTRTTDTYSLKGVTAAMNAIDRACN